MLYVVLSLNHLVSIVGHLAVLVGIAIDLLLDLLVLVEQALCLREVGWDVLGGDCGLGLGQPLLEVVQVGKERLQLARLAQALIAHLQL